MTAPRWLAAVLGLLACSRPDGPTLPAVDDRAASVTVSAPTSAVTVGGTIQATATVLGASGRVVPGRTVTWATSNAAVASVSSSGLVTAVAPGSVVIRAAADGAIGELTVGVDDNRCVSPLVLSPGEVRVVSGPLGVSCLTLAAMTTAGEYLVITANAAPTPDDVRRYSVVAATSTGARLPGDAGSVASQAAAAPAAAPAAPDATDAFEDRLRTLERRLVAGREARGLLAAPPGAARLARTATGGAATGVGDTLALRVLNAAATDPCTGFSSVRAVVRAVGRQVIVAQDLAAPAGGFTDADVSVITSEFDSLIFPTDTLWFGSPSDVDGNGKIVMLFTPEVNKLTPAGSPSYVAGFFFLGDLLPRAAAGQGAACGASNQAEILYLLAPDPRGEFQNVRTTSEVRQGTRGTLAHELQHMINAGVRLRNPVAPVTDGVWIQEAMAHFAEEAVGRASRRFGDFQRLSSADVTADLDDYTAFFRQNLLRLRLWLQRPDTASPISRRAGPDLAPRGAAWALVRYAADQFSGDNARGFYRRLTAGPDTSVANLVARAGVPLDSVLAGFLVAAYTDDVPVAGLAPRYGFRSWRLRDAVIGAASGAFPLFVSTLPGQVSTQSRAGSGNYFRLSRPANSAITIRMLGTGGGPVDFVGARVYVVRLS